MVLLALRDFFDIFDVHIHIPCASMPKKSSNIWPKFISIYVQERLRFSFHPWKYFFSNWLAKLECLALKTQSWKPSNLTDCCNVQAGQERNYRFIQIELFVSFECLEQNLTFSQFLFIHKTGMQKVRNRANDACYFSKTSIPKYHFLNRQNWPIYPSYE